jgi:hypothetical protein
MMNATIDHRWGFGFTDECVGVDFVEIDHRWSFGYVIENHLNEFVLLTLWLCVCVCGLFRFPCIHFDRFWQEFFVAAIH